MNENNNGTFVDTENASPSEKKHKRFDVFAFMICLLAALSVWIYVMNTTQNEVERTITLTVNVNEQISEGKGMTIFSTLDDSFEGSEMDYSKLRVDLTVTGMKNVIDKYSADDYEILVDLDELHTAQVQRLVFKYITPSSDITVKSATTSLPIDALYIDKPATATISQISATHKNVMDPGIEVELSPRLNAFVISGPEKTLASITRAEAVVDLSGIMKSTMVSTGEVKLYGEDGEIKSAYVKIEPQKIYVDAKITAERKFPITFKQATAADGEYKYTIALTGDVTEIVLRGDTAKMSFDSFAVDLGDITKLTELTGTIKLSELSIPDGLTLGKDMGELSISYVITKEAVVVEGNSVGEGS